MTIKGRFGEVEKMVEGPEGPENLRNWKKRACLTPTAFNNRDLKAACVGIGGARIYEA
jgi:hypothetical protein